MPQATTFAQLIAKPASGKVALVEIEPSELVTEWTNVTGDVYSYRIGHRHVLSVYDNGTELTEVSSLADVGAGDWYYENAVLYVSVLSGSIYQRTVVANMRLYFATESKVFNDRFYEPFVKNIPDINQQKNDLFWGVSLYSFGSVTLHNDSEYFDNIFHRYAWNNKTITIRIGGEDLPYSQYQQMFIGAINKKSLDTDSMKVSFIDNKGDFDTSIPTNNWTTAAYPNIETGKVGQPIPLAYGTVYNIPVTCLTFAVGTATSIHSFKICDTSLHSIQSIDQIYVNGVKKTHHSGNITSAQFKLSGTIFTPGDSVTADIQGYNYNNAVEILKEISSNLLSIPYNSTNFDTSTVSQAVTDANDFNVGLYVGENKQAVDVVADLMLSCLGTFFVNNSGLYSIKIFTTDLPSTFDSVNELDINGPKWQAKQSEIRKTIRIGWRKDWLNNQYSYSQQSSTDTERIYGIKKTKTINTLISDNGTILTYLGRVALMLENATIEMKFKTKFQLLNKNIADRIKVSFRRRIGDTYFAWLTDKVVDIIGIKKDFLNNEISIIVDDLKGIGILVGHWTSDTPTFTTALGGGSAETWDQTWSSDQKDYANSNFGYWTDDDGFIDPTDAESLNKSKWW